MPWLVRPWRRLSAALLASVAVGAMVLAQSAPAKPVAVAPELKAGNAVDVQACTPAEQRAAFTVPDGFEIDLVASENVFRAYRVELTDGTKVEGFRKDLDESRGTLMSMGGGTRSIPLGEIKAAGYVEGRSVMPPLAVGLQDAQVADIVRYLKTLK